MERCPECPSRNLPAEAQKQPIKGDLDNEGGILYIGEAPGRVENNMKRVFVGPTGDELNQTYLPRAGMHRKQVNITNCVKCHWADSSDAPPDKVVKSCAQFHLAREIEYLAPSMIVLMGGVANSLMDWDVELEHGIFHPNQELLGWEGPIYSTFHPALGMHRSNLMQALLDDFTALGQYLRGELDPLQSMCPEPIYERLYHGSQVRSICQGRYLEPIAVDTESIKRWRGFTPTINYTPDRLTFCLEPPYAYLVMRKDEGATQEFNQHLGKFRKVYMQNMPHDQWALEQMGIYTPVDRVYDTMSGAYHDGRLAKGLKSLGYRLCGIKMTSFDEIVIPYGYAMALDYLAEANTRTWPKPEQEWTGEMVTRTCPTCKGKGTFSLGRGKHAARYACNCFGQGGKVEVQKMTAHQSLNQSLSRIFTDLEKGPVKVWERWDSWTSKLHMLPAIMEMMAKLGPLPLPSIDYVPDEPAMVYACGDALVTRLAGPILEKRVSQIRRLVR